MAVTFGSSMTNIVGASGGGVLTMNKAMLVRGKLRVFSEKITLAGQLTTDFIAVARILKDSALYGFRLTTDTSLGTSTVAIGTVHAGESAKYKAAGTFTTLNTPTTFGLASAIARDLSLDVLYDYLDRVSPFVDIVLSVGVAALPVGGLLVVETFYAVE